MKRIKAFLIPLRFNSKYWLLSVMVLAFVQSMLFVAMMQRGDKELPITDLAISLATVYLVRLLLNALLIFNNPSFIVKLFLIAETILSFLPLNMAFPTFQMINWHICFSNFEYPVKNYSHQTKSISNKLNILFLGDSFTNGVGIENPTDRYNHLLISKWNASMQPKFSAVNYAKPGLGTGEELRILHQHHLKPDVLLWQYYFNDLDDANPKEKSSEMKYPWPARISVTTNFLTGAVFSLMVRHQLSGYTSEMVKADKETTHRHLLQIDSMVQYCQQNHIRLILLYVPEIISGAESIPVRKHLDSLSAQYHFPIIDSRPLIQHLPVSERVAGIFDPHASEEVHRIWSEALFEVLKKSISDSTKPDS